MVYFHSDFLCCPATNVASIPPVPDVETILDCAHYLHLGTLRGNAVAIMPAKALCALHGMYPLGETVTLVDYHGINRVATVKFSKYEEMLVDITLLELQVNQPHFNAFVPI